MEREVYFYSDGLKIAGVLFEPEGAGDGTCPWNSVVPGHGGSKGVLQVPPSRPPLFRDGLCGPYLGLPRSGPERGRAGAAVSGGASGGHS